MKQIFTNLKKMSLGLCASVLFAGTISATNYTATTSGNWSNSATWGGSGVPTTLGLTDMVTIGTGVNVTLDVDVTVGFGATLAVSGTGSLTSTATNSLTITQGTLSGNGTIILHYIEFTNVLGSTTFSGNMTTDMFVNSGATLTIGNPLFVNDTLILNSGSVAFNSSSSLTLYYNAVIKVDAGTMTGSLNLLSALTYYDVLYVGNSKTTGIETQISSNVFGPHNIVLNMSDSSQVVTLGTDIMLTGYLHNNMGKLAIGTHTLKLMGNYAGNANSSITGIATSRFIANFSAAIASTVRFTNGSQFQYMEMNNASTVLMLINGNFSVDTMNLINGTTTIASNSDLSMSTNGVFIWEGGNFNLGTGNFIGINPYSVIYRGNTKTGSFETSGSGLRNLMVDMNTNNSSVTLNNTSRIGGLLNLNKGGLDLNAHDLYINGTYNSTANGGFIGNANSSVRINNTTAAFGDTLNFMASGATLDSMYINTMANTWVILGSGLSVNTLSLSSGSMMLTSGDLTINAVGSIMGYDSTKYISTNGVGTLNMNVISGTTYVKFPIGSNLNYSPAYIQMNSGTSGMFHVNVRNGFLANGTSGADLSLSQSVVDRTWFIQEPAQSGTLSANLKVEWKKSEEKNGFDRVHSYISHYTNSAWDTYAPANASTGFGTYEQMTRTNITSFSPFAVADQNAVTGIDKITSQNVSIGLYPNPTANFVTIDFKNADAKTVEVFDEIGNKVYSNIVNNTSNLHKIDFTNLPAGVYYVKVGTATEPIFKKFIKA